MIFNSLVLIKICFPRRTLTESLKRDLSIVRFFVSTKITYLLFSLCNILFKLKVYSFFTKQKKSEIVSSVIVFFALKISFASNWRFFLYWRCYLFVIRPWKIGFWSHHKTKLKAPSYNLLTLFSMCLLWNIHIKG